MSDKGKKKRPKKVPRYSQSKDSTLARAIKKSIPRQKPEPPEWKEDRDHDCDDHDDSP